MHSRSYRDLTGRFSPINFLWIFLLFATFSCTEYEDVQYKGIRNLRVVGIENGALKVVGQAVFFNPNNKGMKLRKGEIEVFLDERKTATIIPSDKVRIQPKSEFTIPLEALVEMKESGFLGNILGAISGKTFNLRYEGYIKVSRGLVFSKIRIKDEQKVRM